ncbi:MAG: hypothetical protein Q8M92_07605 [Candidatus Subteraquimicrobiales bacterium]|nr:hypothetical protein [Candidatus Subteraquimicrobiales bacterium]
MTKVLCFFFFSVCLFPVLASAIAPPGVIEKRNLEAHVIAVARVSEIREGELPSHFIANIEPIIKGFGIIKKGDQIGVIMKARPSEKGEIAHTVQGILPVKVKVGTLVVVYLERSASHPGFFNPLLEGLSVVAIDTGNPWSSGTSINK